MYKRWIILAAALSVGAVAVIPGSGCHPKGSSVLGAPAAPSTPAGSRPAGTKPTSAPATTPTGGTLFSSKKLGISLSYPSDWKPKESKDYELLLLPAAPPTPGEVDRNLSLDVPDLPPHLPGMIPMRLVKKGYLDDLKKENGPIETREEAYPIAGVEGRLLISHWEKKGQKHADLALVAIHADRVYILRAHCNAAGEPNIRIIFDAIAKSVQWIK